MCARAENLISSTAGINKGYCIVSHRIVSRCIELRCVVLDCIALHCIVLYSILFYSILFYSILFYSILFYSILFYSILFYSILFYSILFYSILFYSILFYSILFYSILLYCIVLYCIVLYCIVLYCIVLYRPMRQLDLDSFRRWLRSTQLIDRDLGANLAASCDTTLSRLFDAFSRVRSKRMTVKDDPPWFNNVLKAAKGLKKRAERVWRESGLTVQREIGIRPGTGRSEVTGSGS